MDVVAHTLWAAAAAKVVKQKTKKIKSIGWAAFFGVAPDLFAFGPFFLIQLLASGWGFLSALGEPSSEAGIPQYVKELYHISHSLIIFAVVFILIWFIRKTPYWELSAWALHILIDIPTHTSRFFPTPFLWPINNFKVSGISWANPWFMIINYGLLVLAYLYLFWWRRRRANA